MKKTLVLIVLGAALLSSGPKAHAWPSLKTYALDMVLGASAFWYVGGDGIGSWTGVGF